MAAHYCYRIEGWKYDSENCLVWCPIDDPATIRADIKIAGHETSFYRAKGEEHARFHQNIIKMKRIMAEMFHQGERHRAAVIRQAMECRDV